MALGTGAARDMQFFKPLAEEGVCAKIGVRASVCACLCLNVAPAQSGPGACHVVG